MRRIRLALVPVLAVVLAVIAGSAVSAATSANGTAKFTVPVSVSLAQGPGGTMPGGAGDFGTPALGVQTTTLTDDLIINSNDSVGFQLTILSPQASWIESGVGTPNPSHNVPASTVQWFSAAVSGGTGGTGGGTTNSLSTTAVNLFSPAPTMVGTMHELLSIALTPGAATPANTPGMSYVITFTVSVIGL